MSAFFNILKFGKKINKGGKAIDKVEPTKGSSIKETFMAKYRNKKSEELFKLNNPSKTEMRNQKKCKDTGLKEKVNKLLNKKPFTDD
jgi:hypothetical protein